VKLTDAALATAGAATVAVTAGSAQFQIGANSGQTASLSLASAATGTLGLSSLDIQSTSGASAALAAIDTAIGTVSSNRGSIGNFVRNVLESNTRSLGVARENLTAANSSIRDADVAEEMTRFTQLQIMQQSGLSMLAQANSQSQSVLALLRG
jgi:flagellin